MHESYHKKMENVKNLNDKVKDLGILSQENRICENWNDKIRDSLILSGENWKCENPMTK